MSTEQNIIGRSSIDAKALADALRQVAIGETVEYKALTQAIGRDVTVHRHLLESARRTVMRDDNMVFGTVLNVGLKRMDDVETIAYVNQHRRKRIRSQAKKAIRELSTVKYAELPRESQVSHNAGLALFGALHSGTENKHLAGLEAQVSNNKLPDTSGILALAGWISE